MNPHKKGWLNIYFENLRNQVFSKEKFINFDQSLVIANDEHFYEQIQPTGLLYGHPLKFPFLNINKNHHWNEKARMKILLVESLLYSAFHYNPQNNLLLETDHGFIDYFHDIIKRIKNFYQEYCPILLFSGSNSFVKKTNLVLPEYLLEKRISIQGNKNNYWNRFFHNSLLFLDVIYFGRWINADSQRNTERHLQLEKENMRFYILKLMAAAANANQVIEEEEKLIFEYFLYSAHLPPEKQKEAREYLYDGLHIKDIEPVETDKWILKKYFLELAILTLWSDKSIDEQEKVFLDQLGAKLGFSPLEVEKSLLAIEGFVLNNWEDVHFLHNKHNFLLVKNRFMKHVKHIIDINKDRIIQEINESRELMYLLKEARRRPLDPVEKEKVRQQIMDILKTIPTFVIIALPGTFITLPVLLKLLPKKAFPTAWHD